MHKCMNMRQIDLSLIESFYHFSKLKSLNKASELLGISQPALSRRLIEFESQLNIKLFQSRGRKKVLSPIGEFIALELDKQWFDYSKFIQTQVQSVKRQPNLTIQLYGPINIISTIAENIQTDLAVDYLPMKSLELTIDLLHPINTLAVTKSPISSYDLIAHQLFHCHYYLIYPKKWNTELTKKLDQDLQFLTKKSAVFFHRDFTESKDFKKLFPRINEKMITTIPHWHACYRILNYKKSWTILPEDKLAEFIEFSNKGKDQFEILKLDETQMKPSQYFLTYKKSHLQIPWFKSFVQEIRKINWINSLAK